MPKRAAVARAAIGSTRSCGSGNGSRGAAPGFSESRA
jgi:hypothetical protein